MSQNIKGVNNYTNPAGTRNDIEDYSVPFRQVFENEGVLEGINITATTPNSPAINVSPGYILVNCNDKGFLLFRLKTQITALAVNTPVTGKRYLVVFKVDLTNATAEVQVVDGTVGNDPNLTEGGSPDVYYVVLGRITKAAGSDITNAEILADGVTLTNNSTPEIIRRTAKRKSSNNFATHKFTTAEIWNGTGALTGSTIVQLMIDQSALSLGYARLIVDSVKQSPLMDETAVKLTEASAKVEVETVGKPTATVANSFAGPVGPSNLSVLGCCSAAGNLLDIVDTYPGPIKLFKHSGISATITDSFTMSASGVTNWADISFDGANLLSCSSDTNKIYVHSGISATINSSFNAPSGIGSIIVRDGNLISLSTGPTINFHDGISAVIKSSYTLPSGYGIHDIEFIGKNLYILEFNNGKVFAFKGKTSQVLDSFVYPGAGWTYNMFFDGSDLYTFDHFDAKYYKLTNTTLSGNLLVALNYQ